MAFIPGVAAEGAATAAVASPAEAAGANAALGAAGGVPKPPVSIPGSMTAGIVLFVIGYALVYWGWHHFPGQKRFSLWYLLGFGSLFGSTIPAGEPIQLGGMGEQPLPQQAPGQPAPPSAVPPPGTAPSVRTPPAAPVNPGYPPDAAPAQTIKNGSPWWAFPPKGSKIFGANATSPKKEGWVQAGPLPNGVGPNKTGWYNAGAM
jgi:hypothetical protein